MTNSILGFNQSALLKYNISAKEIILLNWMKGFASSINIKRWVDEKTNDTYFWIKYSKVLSDLPCIYQNIFQLQKSIKNLSSKIPGEKPLLKKEIKTKFGTDIYFAFDPIVRKEMEDAMPISIITEKPIAKTTERKQYHKLNPNTKKIISSLLEIKKYDGSKLFRDKSPEEDYTYTNGLKHFEEKLLSIYNGEFNKDFSNSMSESFIRQNKSHDIEGAKKIIRECKGNWNKITDLFIKAAKNYSTWFEPENQPASKDWLKGRCNLNPWVYDDRMNGSLFLACLDGPAFPMREVSAEKVYNSIPKEIRNLFKCFIREDTDGFAFWNKIKSMINWYKKYADDLIEEDGGCRYWLDGGMEKWLYGYCEFLKSFISTVYLAHLGTSCPTWNAFLLDAKKAHEIEARLPKA